MKRILTCLLLLALPALAVADTYDYMKKAYFTLVVLDTGSTLSLLQSDGYVEANPLWKPIIHRPGIVLAADWGLLIFSNWAFDKLHKWSKPVSYVALAACVLIQAYVVTHNFGLLVNAQ